MINNKIPEEYFVMPDDVTVIAEGAFANNKSLKHIDLRNVRQIGAFAFQDCSNLESVIMRNVEVIGPGAFEFCRSLRSVTPGNITEIGAEAFSFCGLFDIPEIPRSLIHVGAGAFSHTAIKRADVHWLEKIPPHLFSCCTSMRYADISGAKVIGEGAFEECRFLSYVRFGDAERIEERAFYRCESLEIASLPGTLEYIGDDAFEVIRPGLVVPKTVKHIGGNCFGPVDRRKSIRLYRSALYEFRNYFRNRRVELEDEDEHFYLYESSIDVTVLDDETEEITGFLPLFSDLYDSMRSALLEAFRPDNTFDYSVLDTVFPAEMRWNQKGKDRLAVMRFQYPYGLTESAELAYNDYLRRHSKRIAMRAVRERSVGILIFLFDRELIDTDYVTELLDSSISLTASECTAFLLERQAELNHYRGSFPDEL